MRGAGILIEKNIPFEPSDVIKDRNDRYIIVSGKLFNRNVLLANVYAPNSDDAAFLERFFSLLPDLNSHALMLGGDFNCWLDPELDRSSPRPAAVSKSAKCIQSFLSEYGLSDMWHFLHPKDKEFSYFSNVHHTYTRNDYFFLDNNLLTQARFCKLESIVISDHAPLVLGYPFLALVK